MRRLVLLGCLVYSALHAQGIGYNRIRIIPLSGTTGEIDFASASNSNVVGFKAPTTLTGSTVWTLPTGDGGNGNTLCTNGLAILSWCAGAGLTPPVTISGSTSSGAILSVNQSGSGLALSVGGPLNGFTADFSSGVTTINLDVGTGITGSVNTHSSSISGTHLQNLGTGDSPTFASCTGCSVAYTGGTGVTVSGSVISIGQSVSTGASVAFNSVGAFTGNFSSSLTAINLDVGTAITGTLNSHISSISGTHLQNLGTGDSPTFATVIATQFENTGWNYSTHGSGTWTASTYYTGSSTGVTSSTCSHFTGGICDVP